MQELEDAVFWGGVRQEIKGLNPGHTGLPWVPSPGVSRGRSET